MNHIKIGVVCCVIAFITTLVKAQNKSSILLQENLEQLIIDGDAGNWEDQLEELDFLLENPLNLNTATQKDLEQFPFLTDLQIENILAHIYIYGEMQTIYELQLVEEMDRNTIDLLLPYVCVRTSDDSKFPSLKNIAKYGKNEVLSRFDIPFYKRQGYETVYHGNSIYHSLRYQFRYGNYVQTGLSGEKDAGEPFLALYNKKGYDHYSYYLVLNDLWKIKTLALGSYRLSFGQGLVLNSNFRLGKTFSLSGLQYRASGIRKHSSTEEYNYFKGIASTVNIIKNLDFSAFYSNRKLDGTIENGNLVSINETGLHRTTREAERRESFILELVGGNVTYEHNAKRIGVTALYYHMNRNYDPSLSKYSKYNLHGNDFYNASIDFRFRHKQMELIGEEAIGKNGYATLNRLLYNINSNYTVMLLHRYYSHDYWSMFGSSFGDSSSPQNENGWYLATEMTPMAHWRFFGSIDLFSHPWWKYRISKPSKGTDVMFQTTYTPNENISFLFNYRYKRKERDVSGTDGSVILPIYHHRARFRMNYMSESWELRSTVDFNQFQQLNYAPSRGYAFSQMVHYQKEGKSPFQFTLQGSYFHTDDYDSRVYAYERGLLNTFYSPSFYGEGFRFTFHARFDFLDHFMLLAKLGQTLYLDRKEIGSGYDLIPSDRKTDLQLQLRIKF